MLNFFNIKTKQRETPLLNLKLFFYIKLSPFTTQYSLQELDFVAFYKFILYICKTKHSLCDHNQACQMRMLYYFNWRSYSNHVTDVNGDDTRKLSMVTT